jgi:RNA polymerase sporulation-specific sigma factor
VVEGIVNLDEQNRELLQIYYDTKDIEAYQSLLILNDKLNYHVARKYLNSGEDVEDLAGIARIGMIKAIKSFDPNKEVKFATYATRCMTNEILMSFRKEKKHKSNISIEQLLSYDGEGNEMKLEDLLDSGEDILGEIVEREEIIRLRQAVEQLSGRDRVIIEEMYFKGKTQKQVSELLGLSQPHISRIEKKLLKKLRDIYDKTKGKIK